MTTDLAVIVPENLLDVRTGELVEATPQNAAELLFAAREMRAKMMGLVKDCEAVLIDESRRQGTKTLHLPAGTAEITATTIWWWQPPPTRWTPGLRSS
jgi:hypothetical protein